MADSVQATKDAIWYLQKDIDKVQTEYNDWANALAALNQMVVEGTAVDSEMAEMRPELERGVANSAQQLAPLLEQRAALEAKLPKAAEPKFDPEKHPLLKKSLEKNEPAKAVIFNTGDLCEAIWTDKQWYKAKILTILGAASAPKYHVKFVDYEESMTVNRDAVRLPVNKRKREVDTAPQPTPATVSVTNSPHVISGPASINPDAQRAKQELEDKAIPHKRKIGSNKALGNRVDNWKTWNSKGVGKKLAKKDSMFRSGTTVNSRVGFTGSGAGMRETHKRVRHNTKADAEEEEEEVAEGGSAGRVRDERRPDNHVPRTRF